MVNSRCRPPSSSAVRRSSQWSISAPDLRIDPDHAPLVALAVLHPDLAGGGVHVARPQVQGLADPQAGAEHHPDHRAHPDPRRRRPRRGVDQLAELGAGERLGREPPALVRRRWWCRHRRPPGRRRAPGRRRRPGARGTRRTASSSATAAKRFHSDPREPATDSTRPPKRYQNPRRISGPNGALTSHLSRANRLNTMTSNR